MIDRLAERGTFASFTLSMVPHIAPPPALARAFAQLHGHMARVHRAGVRIVCSSDAGVAPPKPHVVLAHGAVTLAGLGLTNAEAVQTVTSEAAEACGMGARKGRLACGFDADILAVDGDPLADVRNLLRVAAVFRAGARVGRTR